MARPDICDMRTSRERNRQQLGISDDAAMRETRMTRITQRTCATEYTRGLVSGAHADQQENLEIQKSININTSCSSELRPLGGAAVHNGAEEAPSETFTLKLVHKITCPDACEDAPMCVPRSKRHAHQCVGTR